jgi:hypothetical protein
VGCRDIHANEVAARIRTDRPSGSTLSVDVETEKQLEALVDTGEFAGGYRPKDSSNAALVNRSKVIDESTGRLRETTRTWRQGWIQRTIAGRPRNRDYCDQRESSVGVYRWIAHGDARANAPLFVTDCWVEFHEDYGSSIDSHTGSFVHPWPSIQRTGVPAVAETGSVT